MGRKKNTAITHLKNSKCNMKNIVINVVANIDEGRCGAHQK